MPVTPASAAMPAPTSTTRRDMPLPLAPPLPTDGGSAGPVGDCVNGEAPAGGISPLPGCVGIGAFGPRWETGWETVGPVCGVQAGAPGIDPGGGPGVKGAPDRVCVRPPGASVGGVICVPGVPT